MIVSRIDVRSDEDYVTKFVLEDQGQVLGVLAKDKVGWWHMSANHPFIDAIVVPMKLYSRQEAQDVLSGMWTAYHASSNGAPTTTIEPLAIKKRAKTATPSRPQRWANAVSDAQSALGEAQSSRDRVITAIEELHSMQEEFEGWKDNLSENLQNTPVAEKLDAICGIELEPDDSTSLEELEEMISEAERADLPLGFGRD